MFPIDQLKAALSGDHNIDLLMLSHPMNPVGKVLDRPMLEEIARVCEQANVVICSDEIHCDLLLDARRHTPLASISAEAAARTVTFQAASKTFNLAGLGCAFAVIENPTLRETFEQAGAGIMAHVNTLGFVATQAALSECESWRLELLDYLAENRDRVCEVVERLAGLSIQRPQATYLAWIDVRELALDNPHDFFADYGLGIAAGEEYEGPGYIRLNFGCPRSTLEEGLARLVRAVDSL
jgi:cystathionine beta-lyase